MSTSSPSTSSTARMSFDVIPSSLLLDIFAHLSYADLYRAERVCQRWRSLIEEYVWKAVRCINLDTIGYPDEDYLENFIRLSHLVRKVNEFVCIFDVMNYRMSHRVGIERDLKNATVELVKKRTLGAVFPLDIISFVIVYSFLVTDKTYPEELMPAVVECMAERLLKQFSVAKFRAFRLSTFSVHDPDANFNAFAVPWEGCEIPVSIDLSKMKRLTIGVLRILIWSSCFDSEPQQQVARQMARVRQFVHLESVDVESVEIVMPFRVSREEPKLAIKLYFHPHRCVLSKQQLNDLLVKMAHTNDDRREVYLAEYVKEWIQQDIIKNVEMRIRDSEFDVIEHLCLMGYTKESRREFLSDTLKLLVGLVYPKRIDCFSLALEKDCRGEENMISTIIDDDGEEVLWDEYRGTSKARLVLDAIRCNLKGLDKLEWLVLDFRSGGMECLLAMLEPVEAVKGPLPQLRKLECYGLPCFPFLISLVSQAPNLRYLIVESRPFERAYEGLQWLSKLVEALGDCKGLVKLSIRIVTVMKKVGGNWIRHRANRTGFHSIRVDWQKLTQKLRHLTSTLPSLDLVEMVFDEDHQFNVNRLSPSCAAENK